MFIIPDVEDIEGESKMFSTDSIDTSTDIGE